MKKILLITMAIFLLIPLTNVFAYTGGLLNLKQLNRSGDINTLGTPYTAPTDNDESTASALGATGTAQDTFWYEFSQPVDISHYQGKTSATVYIEFYDANKVLLNPGGNQQISGTKAKTAVSFKDVKIVAISNISGSSVSVFEFDVFEALPTIEHLPITNLSETHNHNTVNLNWTNPTGTEFTGTIIKQNGVEVTQLANNTSGFTVNGLSPETTYNFEVIAKYSDATNSTAESVQVTTLAEPVDNSPTGEITNLMVEKTFETVSFVYSLPIDTDFSHIDIYRNGTLIKANHTLNTFDDIGLVANTSYVYKFVSVDEMGNQSTGYSQTVLTDIEIDGQAPPVPEDVNTTDGNGSGQVTWKASSATDIDGYNVFIDGVKHNANLIKGTTYTIPNLENATTYNITVSAVDTSGNESAQSTIMTITPSLNAMPIFEMKYSLKDVADGTSNWFGSLWLILAFSVAIPLTFLIARRIKGLMVA